MYLNKGSCVVKTDGKNDDCVSPTSKTDCDQATTSGGDSNAANACVFTADTNVQKQRATSWCKDGESMSADPAATPAAKSKPIAPSPALGKENGASTATVSIVASAAVLAVLFM